MTLTHPHGQIYGYPYLTPRAAVMLREARAHRRAHRRQSVHRHPRPRGGRRQPHHRQNRAVHRVRSVRGPVAGRGAHLPEPVRAQPRRPVRRRAGRLRADLPRRARPVRPDVSDCAALHFGAASIRRHSRTARRLLPRRADVGAAQRDQAEVPGRFRVGDGRVHQRHHPGERGRSGCGSSNERDQVRSAGPDQPDRRTHRLQPGFRAADRAARTHGGDLRARRQRRGRRCAATWRTATSASRSTPPRATCRTGPVMWPE